MYVNVSNKRGSTEYPPIKINTYDLRQVNKVIKSYIDNDCERNLNDFWNKY